MYQLYTLRLNFERRSRLRQTLRRKIHNEYYMDNITFCALLELSMRGVDCSQRNSNTLVFETNKDRMYASLLLAGNKDYYLENVDVEATQENHR